MHFDAPYLVFRVVAVEAKRMCTHFVVVATLMHFVVRRMRFARARPRVGPTRAGPPHCTCAALRGP